MADLNRSSFAGSVAPPDLADFIADAIVGGSPFANSLTRRPSRGNLSIPTVNSVSGQGWVAEGQDLPDLSLDTGSEIVTVCKLGGIAGLTSELIEDAEFPIADEARRVVQNAFSADLDDGLLNGTGVAPQPLGVLGRAADVPATSLTEGVADALGQMGEAGGKPSHLAMSPTAIVAEASRTDTTGRPLHPGGLADLYGLTVVAVPGMGTDVLVYDATSVFLVVARDFRVVFSSDYAPAFKADKTAMKVTGRFGVGVPSLGKSVRQVTVTPAP